MNNSMLREQRIHRFFFTITLKVLLSIYVICFTITVFGALSVTEINFIFYFIFFPQMLLGLQVLKITDCHYNPRAFTRFFSVGISRRAEIPDFHKASCGLVQKVRGKDKKWTHIFQHLNNCNFFFNCKYHLFLTLSSLLPPLDWSSLYVSSNEVTDN